MYQTNPLFSNLDMISEVNIFIHLPCEELKIVFGSIKRRMLPCFINLLCDNIYWKKIVEAGFFVFIINCIIDHSKVLISEKEHEEKGFWKVKRYQTILGPRQANLCLRAFSHDKF